MPGEDVSDLREVVDAINKLCETMKTSYDEPEYDCSDVIVHEVDSALVSPAEVVVKKVETQYAERWRDPVDDRDEETAAADEHEHPGAVCEPASEMYYTASSEVSLFSETDMDKAQMEDSDRDKDDRNIIAGHVAAMRERFESMTRANTPCPDLARSLSPSLDVFTNVTPSPDYLQRP